MVRKSTPDVTKSPFGDFVLLRFLVHRVRPGDRVVLFELQTFLELFLVLFGVDDVAFADAVFTTFGNKFDEVVLGHSGRK